MQWCLNLSLIFGYMGDGGAFKIACFLFGTDASSGATFVFLTPGLVAQSSGLCVLSFSIRTRSVCAMRHARAVITLLRHCSLLQLSLFELCSVRFETPLSGSVDSTRQRQHAKLVRSAVPFGSMAIQRAQRHSYDTVRETSWTAVQERYSTAGRTSSLASPTTRRTPA